MIQEQNFDARPDASGGYKVDVSRGTNVDRVSSEWFSRPDDERYLSLDDLFASVKGRAEQSRTRTIESAAIRVEAHRDDPERLGLVLPGSDVPIAPTHWSFGQLASLVAAPAAYLRQLPAPLAGINLQYGLTNHRAEQIKTMEVANGRTELRAVTGPDYGRIYDHELVSAVQRIAGNGTGDTRWKVPGVLDWSTGIYNPRVDVTKETTTLYASDRDVFLFLVDDLNPIEAGLLPDGSPDLYFRGFYCWNSEVGAKTLGIASFYLRAVCQNRNLWGVEDFQEITIRHSKYAASRFAHEAAPALSRFAESSPAPFIDGIRAAREKIVARSDEDRQDFLRKRGFSKAETGRIGKIETAMEALQDRPIRFEPEDLALAGAFVSIDSSGRLRVERGHVRSEDEPVEEQDESADVDAEAPIDEDADDTVSPTVEDEEEEDGLKPLSDRLVMELTAHRTLALRNALAQDPQVAYLAALHAMTLRLFYRYGLDSCVEIEPRNAAFGSQVPGLGDTPYAQAIDQRHETWARNLPKASEDLWEALTEFDSCSREALFAHCVAMSVNAVHDPYQRRPRAIAHADLLAGSVGLNMAKAGWVVTGDSYLGRVTKARILEAVHEAKGEDAADRISGLKKAEMVTAAEDLLAGTRWLPEPLQTPPLAEDDVPAFELVDTVDEPASEEDTDAGEGQTAEDGGEPAIGDLDVSDEDDPVAADAFAKTAAE